MPPLDFHSRIDIVHPTLDPGVAAALLADPTIQQEPLPLSEHGELAGALQDLQRAAASAAAALDNFTVSVSAPLVVDKGLFVAGVLFRRAHDVVPSPGGTGQAVFGAERFEDDMLLHDPPFDGAEAEVQFSPPRARTRYLLEFSCSGAQINVQGSDGAALQANGAFSVVYNSTQANVTYSISSADYWHFFGCKISWLSG